MILIFCQPEVSVLLHLRCILLCFQAVSSLRINLSKSELVGIGHDGKADDLARVLECKMANLPIKYLGMPLGAKHKDGNCWEPVIDHFEKSLTSWKRNYLSKGGRLTLIKSTLSNLPTYYLSTLTIPGKVSKRLERIQCNFLCGDEDSKKKFHLVNWEEVKSPIKSGGLSLRSLKILNKALHGKWAWRYWNDTNSLWKKVVDCKWNLKGRQDQMLLTRSKFGMSLWKGISNTTHSVLECSR